MAILCLANEHYQFYYYNADVIKSFIVCFRIVLEASYSLHNRVFLDNIGSILVFAVIVSMLYCFLTIFQRKQKILNKKNKLLSYIKLISFIFYS